ncbi:MAG: hypothetical protein NT157_05915 [Candidatus Micrarchaeota archaeon]|nr:hypothetical protein [Candidatus Micrarchaeota archaeon]
MNDLKSKPKRGAQPDVAAGVREAKKPEVAASAKKAKDEVPAERPFDMALKSVHTKLTNYEVQRTHIRKFVEGYTESRMGETDSAIASFLSVMERKEAGKEEVRLEVIDRAIVTLKACISKEGEELGKENPAKMRGRMRSSPKPVRADQQDIADLIDENLPNSERIRLFDLMVEERYHGDEKRAEPRDLEKDLKEAIGTNTELITNLFGILNTLRVANPDSEAKEEVSEGIMESRVVLPTDGDTTAPGQSAS